MAVNDLPRVPNFRDLTGVNFIVRATLLGCAPDAWLAVEFAKEPAGELLLMLILPDAFDVGQAIFEPKKGRRSKPARHGKKGRNLRGFPDVSDVIGGKIRPYLNPYDAVKYSPVKYLFPLLNIYEGVNFFVAITDKLTETLVAGIYGPLLFRSNDCLRLPRVWRQNTGEYTIGGPGGPAHVVNNGVLVSSTDYDSTPFVIGPIDKEAHVYFGSPRVTPSATSPITFRSEIWDTDGNVLAADTDRTVEPGDFSSTAISATVPRGKGAVAMMVIPGGFLKMFTTDTFGFSIENVQWWPD